MRTVPVWIGALTLMAALAQGAEPSPAAKPAAESLPVVWTITEGCDHPESAYLDPATGDLFVSQIAGDGGKKDGQGWISRYKPDGQVVAAKWVEGFNAPKGIRGHGGLLYVSDLDEIVVVDVAAAKIARRVPVPNAKFLNDVAAGPDGSVYVSDMFDTTIYRLKEGELSVFAKGPELEYPNGLLVDGDKLICGGWGSVSDPKIIGHLYALDLATKAKSLITPSPTGHLDGIESDGAGGYIVSDWMDGRILHIDKNGAAKELAKLGQGSADIAYLPAKKLLILPRMLDKSADGKITGRVVAYDLSKLVP